MNRTFGQHSDTLQRRRHATLIADVSRRVRRALADSFVRFGDEASADPRALTVPRAAVPLAPAQLAASRPGSAEHRLQARTLYERCLAHYRDAVQPHDPSISVDDVGAAVAHFVAANFKALQGVHPTPEMLLRLERQLVGLVRRSPAWAAASARDRQSYFEQMAILAVLIKESSAQAVAQGPAAIANVQHAARGYLKQLIGLDPDHMTLDADGLSLHAAGPDNVAPTTARSA